jgi:hypothetical protein
MHDKGEDFGAAGISRYLVIWRVLDSMRTPVLKRVGAVLVAVGVVAALATFAWIQAAAPYTSPFDLAATVAGVLLWRGGLRAALWVRSVAVFLLAAGISGLIVVPFCQPPDLTITQIRLDPVPFGLGAAAAIFILGLLAWVIRELGRSPVQDAIGSSGIRRWDMRLPAQAGGGLVALVALLLWLSLHGQSAELATSLALQRLGPDYRYHLSWISSSSNGHGTSVSGVVTAWNDKEIKKVLLHWETR